MVKIMNILVSKNKLHSCCIFWRYLTYLSIFDKKCLVVGSQGSFRIFLPMERGNHGGNGKSVP
jgi:hypothetical protein